MEAVHNLDLAECGIGRTMSVAAAAELLGRLRKVAGDPAVRVLLVTGDPEVFCGGGPEALVKEIVGLDPGAYRPLVRELSAFPLPVVVGMEGAALGAGLGVALALGDFVIAAEESRYGCHFIRMGITPGMGLSFLLAARGGPALAREMLYTGKLYRGRELAGLPGGPELLDRIVPRDRVRAEAEFKAHQVAQSPRNALMELKKLLKPDPAALELAMEREICAFRALGAAGGVTDSIHDYFSWVQGAGKQKL